MQFISEYGMFLLKTASIVIAILIIVAFIAAIASRNKSKQKQKLNIKNINKKYEEITNQLHEETMTKSGLKAYKAEKKKKRKAGKKEEKAKRRRVFVLNFHGDIRADQVNSLREEISAIISAHEPEDEVLLQLESPGGLVHAYGLAASQLVRLKQHKISLTIAIDKVAASGGYLMASVADRIIAAPFAIVGSIGVIAQLPNFNRILKKHDIEFEQITAGEYKRTLTIFGENTQKGREKFQENVDETHQLFKSFVSENRPILDMGKVATGEHWYGTQAVDLKLIDQIMTSDDYLMDALEHADIYELKYEKKEGKFKKLCHYMRGLSDKILYNVG